MADTPDPKTTRWRLTDGRVFVTRHRWYLASCDACGWVGSTEECPPNDEDVICPKCYQSGADCGKVAEAATELPA
jgi:hypothetical protein